VRSLAEHEREREPRAASPADAKDR
jgi:hypothetical protein